MAESINKTGYTSPTVIKILAPDFEYQETYPTVEKYNPKFKFNGPGWYKIGKDVVIVIGINRRDDQLWWKKTSKNELLLFCWYKNRNPYPLINFIHMAPIIQGSFPTNLHMLCTKKV